MKNKVTNFVLTLHRKFNSFNRTNEGGRTIRNTRKSKFKKKGKRLILAAKIVAIWYLLILTGSYLTSDTGAYFNDVEKISGTISIAEDICKEFKAEKEKKSDYYKNFCNDNAGLENGTEPSDPGTGGKGTDPDNPGHNKDGCDDHTNAPCTEVTNIKETHTSSSISISWENPNSESSNFSFVKIYKDDNKTPVGNNLKVDSFVNENLKPSTKYSYKITTVDSSGNESKGVTIEVSTNKEEKDIKLPEDVTDLKGSRKRNSDNIELSWKNPNSDSTNFSFVKIYRDGNKTPVANNLKDGSFVDENVDPSTKYSYKITTVDSSGNESKGVTIEVSTNKEEKDIKLPENVTDLKGSRKGNSDNIELSWKNPISISHVRIYVDGQSIPIVDNVKGEDIKLTSNKEVTYRLTTVDTAGNESIGETVKVK